MVLIQSSNSIKNVPCLIYGFSILASHRQCGFRVIMRILNFATHIQYASLNGYLGIAFPFPIYSVDYGHNVGIALTPTMCIFKLSCRYCIYFFHKQCSLLTLMWVLHLDWIYNLQLWPQTISYVFHTWHLGYYVHDCIGFR